MKNQWHPLSKHIKKCVPENLHPWLFQVNHLTVLLKQYYPSHEFKRIEVNTRQETTQTERDFLGVGEKAVVRKITHNINGQAVIYGRVAIPEATFKFMRQHLDKLDERNIGQILYTNPGVRRGKLYFREVDFDDVEFKEVKEALSTSLTASSSLPTGERKTGTIFARLSIFYWYGLPFTIQEFFIADKFQSIKVPIMNQLRFDALKRKTMDYVYLIRLHRPIPILLILWPVYWALWIAANGFPGWKVFIIFTVGAF